MGHKDHTGVACVCSAYAVNSLPLGASGVCESSLPAKVRTGLDLLACDLRYL